MSVGQSKESVKNHVLPGLAAAPGFASGPVQLLTDIPSDIRQKSDHQPEQSENYLTDSRTEIENLLIAISKADHFLKDLSVKATDRGSAVDHDVLEMHRLILNDPGLVHNIKAKILTDGLTAAAAVIHIFGVQIERFENLSDLKTRARALDIYDISNLLLHELDSSLPAGFSLMAEPCIVVAENIAPSSLIALPKDKLLGLVCASGNPLSHTAIIAASKNIPAVFNCRGLMEAVASYDVKEILIDGNRGNICLNPDSDTKILWQGYSTDHANIDDSDVWKHRKTFTADGQQIRLQANILDLEDLSVVSDYEFDGIGLFRTEISFLDKHTAPDEEIQFMLYRDILLQSGSRRVVFRTFDLGGEKGSFFMKAAGEMMAAADTRGLELCLMYPEKFLIQLRALLRASIFGSSALLFPMVNSLIQLKSAYSLLDLAKQQLTGKSLPFDDGIKIGAMIETPSGVRECSNIIQQTDFISIGSNDLARYGRSDRFSEEHPQTWSGFDPSVLSQIDQIMAEAVKAGRQNDVTLCGEIAGRPEAVPLWLSMGIRSFSVAPHNLLNCRRAFSKVKVKQLEGLKEEILSLTGSNAVLQKLAAFDMQQLHTINNNYNI